MTEDKFLLYKQYVDVIEHIHILMGGVPINGYEYKSEYLKKNSYQWLSKMREQLAYLIWDADL